MHQTDTLVHKTVDGSSEIKDASKQVPIKASWLVVMTASQTEAKSIAVEALKLIVSSHHKQRPCLKEIGHKCVQDRQKAPLHAV